MLWRAVPGYLVLASVDGKVLEVEGSGADVWALLDVPATLGSVATVLAEQYGAPLDTVRADVGAFVDRLAGSGFVHVDG